MKKILILVLILIIVFILYIINYDKKIYYVSLGDSLAVGINSYNTQEYGYSDYISNYLKENNMEEEYIKDFAKSGYRIPDIMNDITLNKKIVIKNKEIGLKQILSEADLVTLSIGANDIFQLLEYNISNLNIKKVYNNVDSIMKDLELLIKEIKKYFKKEFILIGYYNPLPNNLRETKEIDKLFEYTYKIYDNYKSKYGIEYINTFELEKNNDDFLTNPLNVHPSKQGYQEISKSIINMLEKKFNE